LLPPLDFVKRPQKAFAQSVARKKRNDDEQRDISVAEGRHPGLRSTSPPGCIGQNTRAYASACPIRTSRARHRGLLPPQPGRAALVGSDRGGRNASFIANGYVHVICSSRGFCQSEGHYGLRIPTLRPDANGSRSSPGQTARSEWSASTVMRRTMARRCAGDIRRSGHLSYGRVQRVWRHVRISATSTPARPAQLSYLRDVFARFMSSVTGTANFGPAEEELGRREPCGSGLQQYITLYIFSPRRGSAPNHVSHDDAPMGVRRQRRKRQTRKKSSKNAR